MTRENYANVSSMYGTKLLILLIDHVSYCSVFGLEVVQEKEGGKKKTKSEGGLWTFEG